MEKKMKPTFLEKICLALVDRQLQSIKKGSLTLTLPNQEQLNYGDYSTTDPQHLHVHHYRFFTQLVFAGNVGLGESYTESDWSTPDLPHLLALFIYNINDLKKSGLTHASVSYTHLTLPTN